VNAKLLVIGLVGVFGLATGSGVIIARNADKPEPFAPVSGRVTLKGQPVKGGTVILHADAARGNTTQHEPRGTINEAGEFEVYTAGRKGAPAGAYRVTVVVPKTDAKLLARNPYAKPQFAVRAEYLKPDATPLAVSVPAAGAEQLELAVK
jgi:hypothetical protein